MLPELGREEVGWHSFHKSGVDILLIAVVGQRQPNHQPSSMRWAPLLFHFTDEETKVRVTQLERVEPGFTSLLISSRTMLQTRVGPVSPPQGLHSGDEGRDKLCILRKLTQ